MRYLKTLLDMHNNAKRSGFNSEINPLKTSLTIRAEGGFLHIEADKTDKNALTVPVILVSEAASGKGLGKKLMGYLCEHCDKNNVKISLCASPFGWMNDFSIPRVLAFYAKLGFVPDDFKPYGADLVREAGAKPAINKFPKFIMEGLERDLVGLSNEEMRNKMLRLGAEITDKNGNVEFVFFDGTVNAFSNDTRQDWELRT